MRIVEFDDRLNDAGAAMAFVAFDDATAVEPRECAWLGPAEARCAARLAHPRRRAAWLAGRLAARHALARLGAAPADAGAHVEVLPAAGGQPVVTGAARPCGVSIAHGGALAVAVAFEPARTGAVGVDLEARAQTIDPALLDLAFSEPEADAIASAPDAASRHVRILRGWTAKEAVLKAVGRGLRLPLRSVCLAGDRAGAIVRATVPCGGDGPVVPFEIRAVDRPGHIVSVALEASHAR